MNVNLAFQSVGQACLSGKAARAGFLGAVSLATSRL